MLPSFNHIWPVLRRALLVSVAALASLAVSAQHLVPDGYAMRAEVDGESVCLFSKGGAPSMSFSLPDSAPSGFSWLFSSDGETVPEVLKVSAGRVDTLCVSRQGLYEVRSESGVTRLWWLCPGPSAVSMSVDSADCDAVYVRASATAEPVRFGGHTLAQDIVFQWEVADSLVLSARDSVAALEGLYGECVLTLRAVNQAFNSVSVSDTVIAPGVSAGFSFSSRKESAPNEATADGEALSAPAEVVFANTSRGAFTVSEWAMGGLARLYDENPVYQFQRPGTFRIALTVTNEGTGCASTDSSVSITVSEAAIEFPNAFTPNGDGVNDVFLPAFRSLKSYELTIYNKWGRRVFSSSDPAEGWDGRENGRDAAAGTYYFMAEATGYERGVTFRRKGSVTLIR